MKRPAIYGLCVALLVATVVLFLLGASVGSTGLGAWAAGALLGLSGALAQGLFRNPLADPFLLGSASGASLGVALLLATGASFGFTAAAFAGALLGVLLSLSLAAGVQHSLRLLLAGVIVGYVLGAAKEMLAIAVPGILPAMQAFNLGSAGFVGWVDCAWMVGVGSLCLTLAVALARVLDALTLGEVTAHSLGLPLARLRGLLVLVLALTTGTAVAHTGLIGFVGLAAPHAVRAIVKTSHAWLLILASLMGGVLLLGADILARWVLAPQELPVGVLTAVLGGAYLLVLMHRRNMSERGRL
jgi:iron complex transport system permease protein